MTKKKASMVLDNQRYNGSGACDRRSPVDNVGVRQLYWKQISIESRTVFNKGDIIWRVLRPEGHLPPF